MDKKRSFPKGLHRICTIMMLFFFIFVLFPHTKIFAATDIRTITFNFPSHPTDYGAMLNGPGPSGTGGSVSGVSAQAWFTDNSGRGDNVSPKVLPYQMDWSDLGLRTVDHIDLNYDVSTVYIASITVKGATVQNPLGDLRPKVSGAGTFVVDFGTDVDVGSYKIDGSGNWTQTDLYSASGYPTTSVYSYGSTSSMGSVINTGGTVKVRYVKVILPSGSSMTDASLYSAAGGAGGVTTSTNITNFSTPSTTTGTNLTLFRGGNTIIPKILVINYDDPKSVNKSTILPYSYSSAVSVKY